jgi:hypothetical protein
MKQLFLRQSPLPAVSHKIRSVRTSAAFWKKPVATAKATQVDIVALLTAISATRLTHPI